MPAEQGDVSDKKCTWSVVILQTCWLYLQPGAVVECRSAVCGLGTLVYV